MIALWLWIKFCKLFGNRKHYLQFAIVYNFYEEFTVHARHRTLMGPTMPYSVYLVEIHKCGSLKI